MRQGVYNSNSSSVVTRTSSANITSNCRKNVPMLNLPIRLDARRLDLMRLFGVDGCKAGWMIAWEDAGGTVNVECLPNIAAICALKPDFLVIDIPIGLVDCGSREADLQARVLLGARGCCVFPAPLRGMLACKTHREACALGQRINGKGISIQSWGILPKIREVDSHLTSADQSRIREGHPELSFALMNGGQALTERK